MNKLALPSSPKLQFRAFFVTMMLIALGLFGTQTASAAVLDTLHYNGHTYYLISENTYEGAAAESLALGGYLTTINDQGEQDVLWNSWKNSLGTGEGLWIGLEKSHHGSIFVWMKGEPVIFTYWARGEPSNGCGRYYEGYVARHHRCSRTALCSDLPS